MPSHDKPGQPPKPVENIFETMPVKAFNRALIPGNRPACLVHIYPTGPGMGTRHTLGPRPLTIGRDEECEVCVDEQSVSRRHARIHPGEDGHLAEDLKSTNGTFVNNTPAAMTRLKDGDYLRVGNCIYRYLAGGNLEAEYHEEIYRLMISDNLTLTHNKRALLEFLDRELARSFRHVRPLALIMIDIDHFKAINDERGHLAGDATLRELASLLHSKVRKEDLLARYGGEEFTLVLVETAQAAAVAVAEALRQRVEAHPFQFEGQTFHLTISLGVASTLGGAPLGPLELIQQADERLYQAKNAGRNRVVG
jgi:diguanylate cyclase (GGDEF)-like protein